MDSVIMRDVYTGTIINTYSLKDNAYVPELNANIISNDELYTVIAKGYDYDNNMIKINLVKGRIEENEFIDIIDCIY